jgi:23S rRNA pseudouridine955/2504/2580 synthase
MTGVSNVAVTDDEAGIRLDRWFRRHYAELGHGQLEKMLRTGQVRVDGGRSKASARLEAGQIVRVPPFTVSTTSRPRQAPPVTRSRDIEKLKELVIHLDDDVLAINKPPDLAVQGGTGLKKHLDGMLDDLRFGLTERPRLVHRLDKDTSGVLVLGRNAFAAAKLAAAFRDRTARKTYWALVVGVPRPRKGKIVSRIKKKGSGREDRGEKSKADGKRGLTDYEVLESAGSEIAWLSLQPHTGRTHQLRVHCAELGTPILGDGKYGGREAFLEGIPEAKKLHLHAQSLEIPHPRGGILRLQAALPPTMAATWRFFGLETGARARVSGHQNMA